MNTTLVLTNKQLDEIKSKAEVLKFPKDFDLVYQKQLLPGIVILISGEIQLMNRRLIKNLLTPGSLIGWKTLKKNLTSRYQLRIKADTEIILIGRSGLNELKEIVPDLDLLLRPAAKLKTSQGKN